MADDKVLIQLELEDGQLIKAFGRLKKEAKEVGDAVEKNVQSGVIKEFQAGIDEIVRGVPGMQGVVRILGAIPAPIAAATASLYAMKEAAEAIFSQTLEGEKLNAIENSFKVIAQNAGIASNEFLDTFDSMSQGLISNDELMKTLTKSVVQLGDGAKNLAPIFELAIKLSQSMGGSVQENFQLLIDSIANVSTRQLRNVGITLDAEAAMTKYADSIGKTKEQLTLAEKQQAILNAVAEKGAGVFSGIDTNVLQATNAFTQFRNAVNDVIEELQKKIATGFGPGIAGAFYVITSAIRGTKEEAIDLTKKGVVSLQQLQTFLEEARAKFKAEQEAAAAAPARNEALEQAMLNQQMIIAKGNEELARMGIQQTYDELTQDQFREQAKLAILQQMKLEEQLIRKQFDEQKITDAVLLEERLAQIRAQGEARINEITITEAEKQAKMRQMVQEQANRTIANGTANFISSTMQSLAKGKMGWEQFGKGIIGVVGDMAIQIGTFGLAQGILMQALGSNPFTAGAATIVGALALIAIGSALKAFSGGEGGGNVPSIGGGGAAPITGPDSPATQIDTPEDRQQQTGVVINVQGNILDRRETGLAIAEIIAESFDINGTRIITGAV